jgi:hypothetical protein
MQAHEAGGAVGGLAGQPGPGLGNELAGASDGGLQVGDQLGQLPRGLVADAGQGAAGVAGHPGGIADRQDGQLGQLASGPQHRLLGLLAATP